MSTQIHFRVRWIPNDLNFEVMLRLPNRPEFKQRGSKKQLFRFLKSLKSKKANIVNKIGSGEIAIKGMGSGERRRMAEHLELVLENALDWES